MGGVNARQTPAPQNIAVNFPTAGSYAYELDYGKGGDHAGGIAQLTLSARDGGGFALANMPVVFTVSGQNEQVRYMTTDAAGNIPFAYTGSVSRTKSRCG